MGMVIKVLNFVSKLSERVTGTPLTGGRLGMDVILRNSSGDEVGLATSANQGLRQHDLEKIIDNTTITATNTPADIDFNGYANFILTYKLGAGVGGTPTLTITLRVKDANGNVISDTDYNSGSLAASSSGIAFKGYLEAYGTIQVLCTLGGTGTFAASSVILEMKS